MSNDNTGESHWGYMRLAALIGFIKSDEFDRAILHDTVFRGAMADLMDSTDVDLAGLAAESTQHLNRRITLTTFEGWSRGMFDPLELNLRREFFTILVLPALEAAVLKE